MTYDIPTMAARAQSFYTMMNTRRSVRAFADTPVPKEVIAAIIQTAGTAPSGAHKQPWRFCAVQDPSVKSAIRQAAEEEEYASYHGRMSDRWLKDLEPLGTNWQKPFLEIAPWLIVVFKQAYAVGAEGEKQNNYYVNESVGLACGFLLAAIHQAGLVALTHTPSPMNFLTTILNRPANERPFLLIPVGYPAPDAEVPDIARKPLEEISVFYWLVGVDTWMRPNEMASMVATAIEPIIEQLAIPWINTKDKITLPGCRGVCILLRKCILQPLFGFLIWRNEVMGNILKNQL